VRIYDIGARDEPAEVSDRILTVPNVLSILRLAVLPVIYMDLVSGRHLRAFVLLAIFVWTDWFDGYLAHSLGQVTRLGTLLDPISDRLLVVVVGLGMVVSDLLPLWALVVLLVRDVAVLVGGLLLLRGGQQPPAVTRIGKTATFGLMFALPAFILASVLGDGADDPQPVVLAIAWVTFIVSTILYYVAAGQYARQIMAARRAATDGPSDVG
jgi:cardiolipin synthase (CMP-forming)